MTAKKRDAEATAELARAAIPALSDTDMIADDVPGDDRSADKAAPAGSILGDVSVKVDLANRRAVVDAQIPDDCVFRIHVWQTAPDTGFIGAGWSEAGKPSLVIPVRFDAEYDVHVQVARGREMVVPMKFALSFTTGRPKPVGK